ncbi:MAG: hypothetical protein Tsb009_25600 [Planctomycetaceae bacterium]
MLNRHCSVVRLLATCLISTIFLTGCGKSKTDGKSKTRGKSASKTDSSKSQTVMNGKSSGSKLKPFTPPSEVKLMLVSPEQFKKELAKYKGQAVLVDYWATWCTPCRKAFPHTVHLSEEYAKQGLVVISVCMDGKWAARKALNFLNSNNALIVNYANTFDDENDENKAFELYEVNPEKGIPHYKIFDADGKLVDQVYGKDNERIEAAIKKAIGS